MHFEVVPNFVSDFVSEVDAKREKHTHTHTHTLVGFEAQVRNTFEDVEGSVDFGLGRSRRWGMTEIISSVKAALVTPATILSRRRLKPSTP